MPYPIRTAAIGFLNAAPLMSGLERDPDFQLFYTRPSACASALEAGEADLGLIPVIELARIPGLAGVAGIGVAARRQVRSILLVSRSRAEDTVSLLLDPASRTSAVLAQLLLRQWFHAPLAQVEAPPATAARIAVAGLRPGTALLVIGDPALELSIHGAGAGVFTYDLAQAWHAWTGLPFIFALWGVRRGAVTGREAWLARRLMSARQEGARRQEELVSDWSGRLAIAASEVRRYLSEDVEYDLGEEHMAGLRHFLALAAEAGLAPSATPPDLLRPEPPRQPAQP